MKGGNATPRRSTVIFAGHTSELYRRIVIKKRIRTNQLYSRILTSALIALMGIGIGISCSKDTGVSSRRSNSTDDGVSSRRSVGTKPAISSSNSLDFHPQTGVNYDPFAGMSEEDRKAAIGGRDAGEKYLQVIVRHLAHAMNNDKARTVLQKVVPKVDQGDIHLAQIATKYPALLGSLSEGFKDAISDKAVSSDLSVLIQNTPSNGEAILKASKALFDLVLSVATPSGEGWNPSRAIPVFYMPLDDESVTTMMHGIDAGLNPITLPFPDPKIRYPFLLLNFDESSPMLDDMANAIPLSFVPARDLGIWDNIFSRYRAIFPSFSLVSPAYGHDHPTIHGPHYNKVQPIREITIYNDHEGIGSPEIMLSVGILVKDVPNSNNDWIFTEGPYDLKKVDKVGVPYTAYRDTTTQHGLTEHINGNYIWRIRIWEQDGVWNEDDEVCRWSSIYLRSGSRFLSRWQGDPGYARDADLLIRKVTN